MVIEKKKVPLVKLVGALLLCGSCTFADYIEGIDTTDVNGYARDSAFRIQNGSISGQNIVRYYFEWSDFNGYFFYSFDDIKMAPSSLRSITPLMGAIFYRFVIKRNKDSTYSKVQFLQQISGNRYLYKYGTNTTPNDRMLDSSTYDRSIRYKPNNLYNRCAPYPYPWDTLIWEPPLPNNNHLLGYIFYRAKQGVTIDTTAPINLAQWDSIAFYTSTKVYNPPIITPLYFNLVAVYSEGKSDFLTGWTRGMPANAVKGAPLSFDHSGSSIEIKKVVGGYFISLPQARENAAPSSIAVFNAAGVKVAQFSINKGNCVLWKTDNLAEGTYLIRAELPDRSVLTRTVVFSR